MVYLLDAATQALTLITTTYEIMTMLEVAFSLGPLIVVLWEHYEPSGAERSWLDVHDRSGQRIAHFTDTDTRPWATLPRSLACAMGDTVAMAREHGLEIWHLRSGRQLRTWEPAPATESHAAGMHAAQVVASGTGARLAFCGTGSLHVHLVDAATLEVQGSFCLAGEQMVSGLVSRRHRLKSISWAGAFLLQTVGPLHEQREDGLHVLSIQPGSSCLREQLRCGPSVSLQAAFSPDGAFLCVYEQGSTSLGVYETCSGRRVLEQAVVLPMPVPEGKFRAVAHLRWCDLGHLLLLTVTQTGRNAVLDQVLVLQL